MDCGITTNKSLTINWNEITKNIPLDLLHHFVRGYFDGDGSWSGIKKTKFTLTCASKEFIYPFQNELIKNCDLNKTFIENRNNCYYLYYSGRRQMKRIRDYMYADASIFLLRKKTKIDDDLKRMR